MRTHVRNTKLNTDVLFVLVIYLMSILTNKIEELRFLMYGMLFIGACRYSVMRNKNSVSLFQFASRYKFVAIYVAIIVTISLTEELIHENKILIGSLIHPVYLWLSIYMGYYLVKKYNAPAVYRCLKLINGIILFSAVIGFFEYFIQHNWMYPEYMSESIQWQEYRVASIYGHPIKYGAAMLYGIFITFFTVKKKIRRAVYIGLEAFGIFASKSRSIWLALAITVFFIALVSFSTRASKKQMRRFIILLIAVVVFFVSPFGGKLIGAIESRFLNLFSDVSATQRLGTIGLFAEIASEDLNPITMLFGHGEDTASRLLLQNTINIKDFTTTDNAYVSIFYNYGLIALAAVLILLIYVMIRIMKYNRISLLEKILLCVFLASGVGAFFFEITEIKSTSFPLMFCIGTYLGIRNGSGRLRR